MKNFHIRNVPDDLYKRIRSLAAFNNRSLNAQVITLLEQAVEAEERRVEQTKVLNSIQRRRFKAPKNAPSSLDFLRKDRGR